MYEQRSPNFVDLPDHCLRASADAMPHIVWLAKADGTIDYVNSKWHELTPLPAREDMHEAWVNSLHPTDRSEFLNVWNQAISTRGPCTMEFRLASRGEPAHRWQKGHVQPLRNSEGQLLRWIGSCHDIHDQKVAEESLKTSEARLRSVIEESPVGVVLLDANGEPVYYNRKCAELRGLEVDQETWVDVLHPEDRERVTKSWAEAADSGQPWNEIYRFLHGNGGVVWVSGRAVPIRSLDGGQILGFIRTLEDVTQFKNTEEQLRQAHRELALHAGQLESEVQQRTAKIRDTLFELDKLSYSIVHDMRAPLRTISGFAHLLLEGYSNRFDPGVELLKRIAEAARRQDRLIQDVLVYHSYLRDDFPLFPVDLDAVINGILETYANLQPPRAHVIVERPLGWVMAHETLLTQCVSALLNNAAKFVTPGTKPEIRIFTESAGNQSKLWICDNGIGIAPQSVPKLFDIFYKFHRPEEYPGSGVGLPLAKKGVERMQGDIGVESEPGKGAKFWIALQKAAAS